MLAVGSLFAGVGGMDRGLERAGMTVRWQIEIDPFCRRVLERHWPGVPKHGDIREVRGDELEPVDLVCGGFPCQDLSVAGRRAGLAGERSGLFFEFMRLAARIRPRWLLIENVPGLLSSNGGRDMGAVIGALGELGYGYAWRVLDAQYFGVAQRRRRVFIVGCAGDRIGAATVLFEPESCGWDPPPRREARAAVTPILEVGARTNGDGYRDGDGIGREGDSMYSLQAAKQHAVAYQCHGGNVGPMGTVRSGNGALTGGVPFVAQPLRSGRRISDSNGDEGNVFLAAQAVSANQRREVRLRDVHGSLMGERSGAQFDGVMQRMAVRRLTPTEGERLQGFPDGWTLLGDDTPDSPRYRALGNAVCVPVAEWIGRRILAHAGGGR